MWHSAFAPHSVFKIVSAHGTAPYSAAAALFIKACSLQATGRWIAGVLNGYGKIEDIRRGQGPQSRDAEGMVGSPEAPADQGKKVFQSARPIEPGTPRSSVGKGRERVYF